MRSLLFLSSFFTFFYANALTITSWTPSTWSRAGAVVSIAGSGFNSLVSGSYAAITPNHDRTLTIVSDTLMTVTFRESDIIPTGGSWTPGSYSFYICHSGLPPDYTFNNAITLAGQPVITNIHTSSGGTNLPYIPSCQSGALTIVGTDFPNACSLWNHYKATEVGTGGYNGNQKMYTASSSFTSCTSTQVVMPSYGASVWDATMQLNTYVGFGDLLSSYLNTGFTTQACDDGNPACHPSLGNQCV